MEGAAPPLGDQVVARLPVKLVDDVRPARGRRAGAAGASGVGAAGSAAHDIDQDDGEIMFAERLGQGRGVWHDVGD